MIAAANKIMRHFVHGCRNRFSSSAVILLYHRVIELPSDPYLLTVSPSHFAQHLAVLQKETRPTSLRQLTVGLRNGNVPRRAVVITFDDGYFDNLVYAKPLLEQYDTPATVFVTAGFLSDAREFWWDTLERILLGTERLPETLSLAIGGTPHEWQLGSAAAYGPEDQERYASWNYGWKDAPTPRHALFRSVHQSLKPLNEDTRRNVLQDLAVWACADAGVRPSHRMLSADETVSLAAGGLVEIGAHTMTHPVLSALPVSNQRDEIRQSKTHLEYLLGHRVTSFAYPHGLGADYTQETITTVRESGFECACAAWPGTIGSGADVHQLPRFLVRDQDGEAFAEEISRYYFQD